MFGQPGGRKQVRHNMRSNVHRTQNLAVLVGPAGVRVLRRPSFLFSHTVSSGAIVVDERRIALDEYRPFPIDKMDVSWPTFIWRSKRGKGEDIRRERENGYYTQSPPTAGGADSYIPCYIPFLSFFSFLVLYGLCLYYGKEYFFFLARDITNQTLNNSHGHNNNNKKKKKK